MRPARRWSSGLLVDDAEGAVGLEHDVPGQLDVGAAGGAEGGNYGQAAQIYATILKAHPEFTKVQLGWAMTGLSVAYGISKFVMGSVSDRSNPRWFMALGLLLTSGVTFAFGTVPAIYDSLALIIALQTLNGWVNGMGWPSFCVVV